LPVPWRRDATCLLRRTSPKGASAPGAKTRMLAFSALTTRESRLKNRTGQKQTPSMIVHAVPHILHAKAFSIFQVHAGTIFIQKCP
jgi:predicted phage tail protein